MDTRDGYYSFMHKHPYDLSDEHMQWFVDNTLQSEKTPVTSIGVFWVNLVNGIEILCKGLEKNNRVTSLTISSAQCNAGRQVDDIRHISQMLRSNTTLEALSLINVLIGDENAVDLANALASHPQLETLKLEGCNIGLHGCKAIANALRTHPSLKSLDISFNHIGDDGVLAIVEALRHNRRVKHLYMRRCNLGINGMNAVIDVLYEGYIIRLNIAENYIDMDMIQKFFEISQKCPVETVTLRHPGCLDRYDPDPAAKPILRKIYLQCQENLARAKELENHVDKFIIIQDAWRRYYCRPGGPKCRQLYEECEFE